MSSLHRPTAIRACVDPFSPLVSLIGPVYNITVLGPHRLPILGPIPANVYVRAPHELKVTSKTLSVPVHIDFEWDLPGLKLSGPV